MWLPFDDLPGQHHGALLEVVGLDLRQSRKHRFVEGGRVRRRNDTAQIGAQVLVLGCDDDLVAGSGRQGRRD